MAVQRAFLSSLSRWQSVASRYSLGKSLLQSLRVVIPVVNWSGQIGSKYVGDQHENPAIVVVPAVHQRHPGAPSARRRPHWAAQNRFFAAASQVGSAGVRTAQVRPGRREMRRRHAQVTLRPDERRSDAFRGPSDLFSHSLFRVPLGRDGSSACGVHRDVSHPHLSEWAARRWKMRRERVPCVPLSGGMSVPPGAPVPVGSARAVDRATGKPVGRAVTRSGFRQRGRRRPPSFVAGRRVQSASPLRPRNAAPGSAE
jgi:hypothetical protein